jgi:hypothetical protein
MVTSGERHPSTAKLLSQMLEDILTNHNPIMICVDGLDECEEQERRKFLAVVDAVIRTSSPYPIARFFLTSRKEKDLESSLRSAIRLTIKPSHVEKDIISYIQTQTSKLSEKFGLTIEEGQRVATTVATRPKGKRTLGCHSDWALILKAGMFLLARLIMDNLIIQDDLEELEGELDNEILPHGIDEAWASSYAYMS